jgi:ABC-type transport system involved in cytochrome c biogenesis ATPase subunit
VPGALLSTGQAQARDAGARRRVGRALWLLDEPLNGLDSRRAPSGSRLIARIRARRRVLAARTSRSAATGASWSSGR